MPAPHALYSKMLAERTASRNVLVLFILFIYNKNIIKAQIKSYLLRVGASNPATLHPQRIINLMVCSTLPRW